MGVHVYEIIQALKLRVQRDPYAKMKKFLSKKLHNSINYWMEDYAYLKNEERLPFELFRLPYDTIYLESKELDREDNEILQGSLCINMRAKDNAQLPQALQSRIMIIPFLKHVDEWVLAGIRIFIGEKSDGSVGYHWERYPKKSYYSSSAADCEENAMYTVFKLEKFLQLLYCSNIITIDNDVPDVLPHKSIRRRDLPLYRFKTLRLVVGDRVVNKNKTYTTDGGWHLPVHIRRGYFRHLKNGEVIWVDPYCAGKVENGMLTKEYEIREAKEALSKELKKFEIVDAATVFTGEKPECLKVGVKVSISGSSDEERIAKIGENVVMLESGKVKPFSEINFLDKIVM